MPAPAELRADHAWVAEEREASTLYNKGAFGLPQKGGALRLDLLEAAHLVEHGRLTLTQQGQPAGLPELLAVGTRLDAGFETRWLAYRDLRRRGYIVKAEEPPGPWFHVYPRGGFPGKTASLYQVLAVGERGTFDLEQLVQAAAHARRFRKELRLAIVDEEGDITYYDVRAAEPQGQVTPRLPDLQGVEAQVLRDRAVVWQAPEALHRGAFVGRQEEGVLLLSLAEALWLADQGLGLRDAATSQEMDAAELRTRAAKAQPDFALRQQAFEALRGRGLVVKTGYKYGAHFRVYTEAPDKAHAEFLAHALPPGFTCPWPDIAGVVRVAHSVRKTLLFVSGDRVLSLERAKP